MKLFLNKRSYLVRFIIFSFIFIKLSMASAVAKPYYSYDPELPVVKWECQGLHKVTLEFVKPTSQALSKVDQSFLYSTGANQYATGAKVPYKITIEHKGNLENYIEVFNAEDISEIEDFSPTDYTKAGSSRMVSIFVNNDPSQLSIFFYFSGFVSEGYFSSIMNCKEQP